jgi:SAM-dependent methyltransferase
MMQTRNEKLLHYINPTNQVGIEIGPLNNPVVTREMGKVYYIDHATTEALRIKYANDPNVDVNQIVDVDYVWGEKGLAELTQANQPFDYLIASHVIEHVPDLIGWLEEIRSILKPGGILSLVIPDKRQCFDYKRQPTRLCDLFEAYLHRSRQPTSRQIFDHYASAVSWQGLGAWADQVSDPLKLMHFHSLADAQNVTKAAFESGAYCDVHCWTFTPASFFRLLEELAQLGLVKFEVAQFYETNGCEFFVSLRAVDTPHYPASMQPEAEEETFHLKPPNEVVRENQLLRTQLQEKQRETDYLQASVKAMESSKFWRMRGIWLKMKQKLGLPT